MPLKYQDKFSAVHFMLPHLPQLLLLPSIQLLLLLQSQILPFPFIQIYNQIPTLSQEL